MNGGSTEPVQRKRGRPRKQLVISNGTVEPTANRTKQPDTGDENRTTGSTDTGNNDNRNTGNSRTTGNFGSGNTANNASKETFQNVENSAKEETVSLTNLFVDQPKKRRGRPKKEKNSQDSKAIATLIIDTVDLFVTAKLGASATFNPTERLLIQPSLEHLITRYGGAAERLSGWIDPVLLVGGIALYVSRISQLVIDKTPENKPITPSNNGFNPAENIDNNPPIYGVSPDIHDMFNRE